ncbi:hypothetical protein DY000_02011399 [Brassica cretica]|uniref:Chlorophyll a-b binding protein, chloroplastic n=1 Tax=Brassica cretica TaxID=69181 RepID=A0ABQ7D8Y4_BRACR|nr:hypothetical protein DY000_02011399 [Brassica cretica]
MASRGVLKLKPMFFQKRFPPLPGLFPFPDFFELRKTLEMRIENEEIEPVQPWLLVAAALR